MKRENFIFAIPLRARAASRNWAQVTQLLGNTLRSILGQTDPDIQLLIACHDIPEQPWPNDPRVSWLVSTRPLPKNHVEQMDDKHHKRRMIAAEFRRRGGGYLMAVDADDLVSRRVTEFARRKNNQYGYILHFGYELDAVSQRYAFSPRFNRLCGTSGIFRFAPEDLPEHADDPKHYVSDNFQNHTQWESEARRLGRPMGRVPFCGAAYVINHGENHSAQSGNIGMKRRLLRALSPSFSMSAHFMQEFSIQNDN